MSAANAGPAVISAVAKPKLCIRVFNLVIRHSKNLSYKQTTKKYSVI